MKIAGIALHVCATTRLVQIGLKFPALPEVLQPTSRSSQVKIMNLHSRDWLIRKFHTASAGIFFLIHTYVIFYASNPVIWIIQKHAHAEIR